MATIATPTPAAVEAPVAPLVPPLSPNLLHNREDRIEHALRVSAAAAKPSLPVVPVAAPAVAAVNPAPVDASAPAVEAALTEPVAPELDLEAIDFDAETPAGEAKPPEVAQVEDVEPWKQLQRAIEAGDPPEAVQGALLKSGKGRKILETFKITRELEKPVEEGGIGHYPTVEEIKAGYTHTQHVEGMRNDYLTDPVSFVHNMLVPNPEGKTYLGQAQHAAKILRAIPQELLKSGQHQLYEQAYLQPALALYLDHSYETALAMKDTDEKFRLLDSLQILEFRTFGEARPLPGLTAPADAAPRTEDPEFKRLKAQLDSANKFINQQRTHQQQAVVSNLESANFDTASKSVEKVLEVAGLKAVYPGKLLDGFKSTLSNLVHSKIMGLNGQPADPGGLQQYKLQLQAALRNGGDTSLAKATYRRMFLNRLQHDPEVKAELLNVVTAAKSRSDSSLAGARAAQSRTEPVGTGTAPPAPVVSPAGQLTRQPGETKEDALVRQLNAVATPRR